VSVELRSARLLIRPIVTADIPAFVAYRRDPEIARHQSWSTEYSATDAQALVDGQPRTPVPSTGEWVQLGLHARDAAVGSSALMGDVAVGADPHQPDTYELGVTLAPAHHGQGYAREALDAVIDWLMERQGAHRIVMQGDARNAPVLALMRRLGLRHEGAIVEGDWFKGAWSTLERFALLDREWRESRER